MKDFTNFILTKETTPIARSEMKWRTEIENIKQELKLRPERGILLTGSCFADYIGDRMRAGLWNAQNPFGVLFNPLSIAESLRIALISEDSETEYAQSIFESEGKYLSWLADTSLRADSLKDAVEMLMVKRQRTLDLLTEGKTLCVTFGTAYCYFLNDGTERIVSNCHKQPQSSFVRKRVSVEDIYTEWAGLIAEIKGRLPDLNIIFTVSPVRHVRDGLHDNTLSKATLHLAVEQICSQFDFCYYFPAYEIVNDDLRDYRFYAADLVHPSDMAVEYIWEIFKRTYIDDVGEQMLKKGEAITRRASHRPFFPDSPDAISFVKKTKEMYDRYRQEYPHSLEIPI